MVKKIIYISEPEEINIDSNKFETKFEFLKGDIKFKKNYNKHSHILLIRTKTRVDRNVLNKFPNVKHIIRTGVGLDNIDLDACREKNVKVYNSGDANANAVSDYVVCMILLSLRKIHKLSKKDLVKWNRYKFLGREVSEEKYGIIGFGNIGRKVYDKLSGLGAEDFYVYDPFIDTQIFNSLRIKKCNTIKKVFKNATVITLHIPLNSKTFHIINSPIIRILKKEAILVNASRGGIVDENAIIDSTKNKKFTYIADVFESEPKIRKGLLKNPNVIPTPHIAAMTHQANQKMVDYAMKNFLLNKNVL